MNVPCSHFLRCWLMFHTHGNRLVRNPVWDDSNVDAHRARSGKSLDSPGGFLLLYLAKLLLFSFLSQPRFEIKRARGNKNSISEVFLRCRAEISHAHLYVCRFPFVFQREDSLKSYGRGNESSYKKRLVHNWQREVYPDLIMHFLCELSARQSSEYRLRRQNAF